MKALLTRSLIVSVPLLLAGIASAQMPATLRDANAPGADDWAKAAPALRNALECRSSMPASKPVLSVFRLTNHNLNGDHKLPQELVIFGSIKVSTVSVFIGDEEEGSSYTVQPAGVTMDALVKAAGLKKDKHGARYVRVVKGGLLEASQPQPGTVQLACIRGGGHD